MAKSGKKKKLELLKAIAASQTRAVKLEQEQHINIVQTKLMEKELNEMKQHLEELEQKRNQLIQRQTKLENEAEEQ